MHRSENKRYRFKHHIVYIKMDVDWVSWCPSYTVRKTFWVQWFIYEINGDAILILAATKQLYEWFSPSVYPSVTLFFTMFPTLYHHEILRSDYQWQM